MTFRNYISLSIFLFLFTACAPEEVFVLPIEEDKLVDILCDVHIAEAALKNLKGKVKDSTNYLYYQQIYQIHQIDSTLFMSTMETLRNRPKDLENIYKKVKNKLTFLEKEAIEAKKAKKELRDSSAVKYLEKMSKLDSLGEE